jgi:phage repressor protein C with HTH and peptisase S24 domain
MPRRPAPTQSTDPVRIALEALIAKRGDEYVDLSRLLNRNSAYIQQFLKRGTPRKLDENDRRILASYYGVSETVLGAPASASTSLRDGLVAVPRYDIGASAGPGANVDGEVQAGTFGVDAGWARDLGCKPDELAMLKVKGHSMEPLLCDGDDILIDRSAAQSPRAQSIYLLRYDGDLLVKRLVHGATLIIRSENPAYPDINVSNPDDVAIIGRVVWSGRKIA